MTLRRRLVGTNLLTALTLWTLTTGIGRASSHVAVINMIPNALSGETKQDSEPNVAVNPADPNQIAGSAFTKSQGFCAPYTAPIFVSTNGGSSWALNCIVPSDSAGTGTGDITVRFSATTNNLYAGILRLPGNLRLNILRTESFTGPAVMTPLVDRDGAEGVDQPYVQATTVAGADRVYVGNNDFNAPQGRTATIDQSLNANWTGPKPSPTPLFAPIRIEPRETASQDGPPIRPAIASNGNTIYAAYRANRLGYVKDDMVVVRDDNGGAGPTPFTALLDPGDGLPGMRVVKDRDFVIENFSHANFGQERLGASLTIAVNPIVNTAHVCLAWGDRVGNEVQTLHVRCSSDSGKTWSPTDLRTITNATNPALAINSNGTVGFLYQQVTGTGANQRWVTHLERTNDGFTTVQDLVLADVPANAPPLQFLPYIGDYVHLMAIGSTFYGVFSANNTPDSVNFPNGVTYQRNVNFATKTLLDTDNVTPVAVSIDPFFFKVHEVALDPCVKWPWLCVPGLLEPGAIVLDCPLPDCIVMDPIPKNCLVKFDCPGCPPGALCPPWYHLFLDGLADVWNTGLFDGKGKVVPHQQFKTPTGIVLSFRPSNEDYIEGQIGNYVLAFKLSSKGKPGVKYRVRIRVERGDRPYQPEKPRQAN